jgi:hypothetical protein
MPAPAARVTIRVAAQDVGHRAIDFALDGERWTALVAGQSATREITPGRHTLKADNTLFHRSMDFDVAAGEDVCFSAWNREGRWTWIFMIFGAPLLHLSLERETPPRGNS